jgi:hypothetical protein
VQSFLDRFSAAYSKIHLHFLRPMVLIPITGNEYENITFSYLTEFEESDVFNTSVLGVRQRSPNCAALFINETNFATNVGVTIGMKYGRPHKD